MRPYQISAVEAMVKMVQVGIEKKLEGTPEVRGYIWHATGSGKTLTSWKATELISKIEGISKVLFVVDRKVLDSQTQREFHKFGDINDETRTNNTYELIQKLKDPSCRIINTTFQKLNKACKHERFSELPILKERVVFIFDECHRSQGSDEEMGNMRRITEDRFKRSFIFGVSGTPIFQLDEDGKETNQGGTKKYFTKCLSAYTLLNALQDKNVLAWRYDEAGFRKIESYELKEEAPLKKLIRKRGIVDWVLHSFELKTKGSAFKKQFNSLFIAESIADLLEYYEIFKEKFEGTGITVTAIFSINPDESKNSKGNIDALQKIIEDYNKTFKTGFDLKFDITKGYESWREDLTKRLRNVEIDILLVVAMFLTGFDSAALNTLWIDKNISSPHELIQIFSRTNRIHSELKDVGNIVSFVPLVEQRDKALNLYAGGVELAKAQCIMFEADFEQQYVTGKEVIEKFKLIYPDELININEKNMEDFMRKYNEVLKTHKKLSCYSEYKGKELLAEEEKQNYNIKYLDCTDKIEKQKANKVTEGIEIKEELDNYAIELIRSEDVDIHYILRLIAKGEEKEKIMKKVHSNTRMRVCAPLIDEFIDKWEDTEKDDTITVDQEWSGYIEQKKDEELDNLIQKFKFKNGERGNIKEILMEEEKDKVLQGNWLRNILPYLSYFDPKSLELIKEAKAALLDLMNRWEKYRI